MKFQVRCTSVHAAKTQDRTEQRASLVLEGDGEDGLAGEACRHDDGLLQDVEQVPEDDQLSEADVDGQLGDELPEGSLWRVQQSSKWNLVRI